MKEVILDALSATTQLVKEKNIMIEHRLPNRVPIIAGDRDRLIQVMVNLISNAVKFCDNNQGRIDVMLNVEPKLMRVDVKDNGIGIREADTKIIFEEFRQIKDTTRGRPRGSGLGLAIAKRIIDFHDGRIWVESKLGTGSTFSFVLPIETKKIKM